jgi:hypothetical protein
MGKATKYATLGVTKKSVNAMKPQALTTLMASMTSKLAFANHFNVIIPRPGVFLNEFVRWWMVSKT